MTTEPTFVRRARLSRRYAVEVTATLDGIFCVWDPKPPLRLNRKEMKAYERVRDAAVADLAAHIGQGVMMVDVGDGPPSELAQFAQEVAQAFWPDGRTLH